ncbi:MAG: ribonuclease P protein component [Candidatus Binatia bacterium]
MSQGGERFPKKARLTRRSEFLNLSRGGRKVYTSHFVVISKTNDRGENRLGITVSTRVGKAVVRNRVKRLLREFFRRHRHEIPPHQDIVIIARKGAGRLSFDEVVGELRGAFNYRGSHKGSAQVV